MQASTLKSLTWAGFVLVLIGTALPWARIERHTQRTEINNGYVKGVETRSVGGFSLPGYASSAGVQGISLPGWLVVVASLVCAILSTRSSGLFWLPLLLSGYGLLHVGFMFVALWSTPNMSPSNGIFIVLVGFLKQLAYVTVENRASSGETTAKR